MRYLIPLFCLYFCQISQALHAIWGGYEPPPAPVHVAESEEKNVSIYYTTVGTLAPATSVQIRAELTGMLLDIHAGEGDQVEEGTLLFTIDSEAYDLKLQEAQAALQKDKLALEHAQLQYERTEQLLKQQAVSESEHKKVEERLDSARSTVHMSEARLHAAEIPVRKSLVRAPITGRMGEIEVGRGNVVKNNDLLVIIDKVSSLTVQFAIPERRFASFRQELEAGRLNCDIWLPHEADTVYQGKVIFFQNRVDKETGTIGLKAAIDNSAFKLWPGQFVKIRLLVEELKDVIVVPSKAVRRNESGAYVFVLDASDVAELRYVELGAMVDDEQVIEKGLEAGERVVVEGQLDVQPGRQVKIIDGAGS